MPKPKFFLSPVLFGSCFLVAACIPNSSLFFPVNGSTIWTNNDYLLDSIHFIDGSVARFILMIEPMSIPFVSYTGFGCGFFCLAAANDSCYFTIVIVEMLNGLIKDNLPQVVWLANQDYPVCENATLKLSQDGDMILADRDGKVVWSTNTSGKSISGMIINELGNLVLLNQTNGIVWQSFDHPMDTLLVSQKLSGKQRLTSRVSPTDLSHGLFYLSIDSPCLSAFVEDVKPIRYQNLTSLMHNDGSFSLSYVRLYKATLMFFFESNAVTLPVPYGIPANGEVKFLRLDSDGGLRLHIWAVRSGWSEYALVGEGDECQFPLKCGRYGVCKEGQCICPRGVDGIDYFSPINNQLPNLGCHQVAPPPSQLLSDQYQLVDFGHLSYFSYFDPQTAVVGLNDETGCKQACSENSFCKGAFFWYLHDNASDGYCYLPSDILTMIAYPMETVGYNSSSSIKMHTVSFPKASPFLSKKLIHISTLIVIVILLTLICWLIWWKKKHLVFKTDDLFERVSKAPSRFSYAELCSATGKFSKMLGGGGFGAVFKGVLTDGTLIAVKRLDKSGQGTKEFLAEVETIGNIHHVNLVRLVGFCAEKSYKLLVYEYMSNGSLDQWIFYRSKSLTLDWRKRCKIVLDIAKALEYLHEGCTPRIAHLDVKPHNILIDENFSAKLSDFGLSKLIDRDQSQVLTGIRGTLGYLAPEWQHSFITVKADIYSFGVVLIEVVSGRKNLDYTRPESEVHLLCLLQRKAEENQLIDIADYENEDMQHNKEEVLKIIRLGMWCLNEDHAKRPTMSTVVKVLEGTMELEANISYTLSHVIPPPPSSVVSLSPKLQTSVLATV